MWPDWVSNQGPLTYESDALLTVLRGPAPPVGVKPLTLCMNGCSLFTQGVEGSTPTGGICLNNFSDPIDQDICTQCALSCKNSGIRVVVGDCNVTERQRWCLPYHTGKTVHVHANTLQT